VVRLAALRRTEEDLRLLKGNLPEAPLRLPTSQRFACNFDFHVVLLDAAQNPLLRIAAQPILRVLERNVERSDFNSQYYEAIHVQHTAIAEAVEAQDPESAASLMRDHLHYLRGPYERGWRHHPQDRGA
jgi:GntR family transcriptional regulator, transcriptional repressor for pyruvate dehydrogenase complex